MAGAPKGKRGKDKGQNCEDRRSSPRLSPEAYPSLKGACLVSGSEVKLINISKGGALLESVERLSPSTRISLRLITTEGVIQLYGQILRSTISHLNGGLRYRSAVSFEQEFPLQTVNATAVSTSETERETPSPTPENVEAQADSSIPAPAPGYEDGSVVALTACVLRGEPDLSEFFRVNKW